MSNENSIRAALLMQDAFFAGQGIRQRQKESYVNAYCSFMLGKVGNKGKIQAQPEDVTYHTAKFQKMFKAGRAKFNDTLYAFQGKKAGKPENSKSYNRLLNDRVVEFKAARNARLAAAAPLPAPLPAPVAAPAAAPAAPVVVPGVPVAGQGNLAAQLNARIAQGLVAAAVPAVLVADDNMVPFFGDIFGDDVVPPVLQVSDDEKSGSESESSSSESESSEDFAGLFDNLGGSSSARSSDSATSSSSSSESSEYIKKDRVTSASSSASGSEFDTEIDEARVPQIIEKVRQQVDGFYDEAVGLQKIVAGDDESPLAIAVHKAVEGVLLRRNAANGCLDALRANKSQSQERNDSYLDAVDARDAVFVALEGVKRAVADYREAQTASAAAVPLPSSSSDDDRDAPLSSASSSDTDEAPAPDPGRAGGEAEDISSDKEDASASRLPRGRDGRLDLSALEREHGKPTGEAGDIPRREGSTRMSLSLLEGELDALVSPASNASASLEPPRALPLPSSREADTERSDGKAEASASDEENAGAAVPRRPAARAALSTADERILQEAINNEIIAPVLTADMTALASGLRELTVASAAASGPHGSAVLSPATGLLVPAPFSPGSSGELPREMRTLRFSSSASSSPYESDEGEVDEGGDAHLRPIQPITASMLGRGAQALRPAGKRVLADRPVTPPGGELTPEQDVRETAQAALRGRHEQNRVMFHSHIGDDQAEDIMQQVVDDSEQAVRRAEREARQAEQAGAGAAALDAAFHAARAAGQGLSDGSDDDGNDWSLYASGLPDPYLSE